MLFAVGSKPLRRVAGRGVCSDDRGIDSGAWTSTHSCDAGQAHRANRRVYAAEVSVIERRREATDSGGCEDGGNSEQARLCESSNKTRIEHGEVCHRVSVAVISLVREVFRCGRRARLLEPQVDKAAEVCQDTDVAAGARLSQREVSRHLDSNRQCSKRCWDLKLNSDSTERTEVEFVVGERGNDNHRFEAKTECWSQPRALEKRSADNGRRRIDSHRVDDRFASIGLSW